jgi:hypothetical protein
MSDIDCVRQGTPVRSTLDDGRRAVAAMESTTTGRLVAVDAVSANR